MNEAYLKQLIKSAREKSALIVFLFSFLLVIIIAFNLLLSTLINQNSLGKISDQAASTEVGFDESQNASDQDSEIVVYFVQNGDSTWKIATELLGNGRRYPEIEQLNGFVHNQRLDVGQIVFVDTSEIVVTEELGAVEGVVAVEEIGVAETDEDKEVFMLKSDNYLLVDSQLEWEIEPIEQQEQDEQFHPASYTIEIGDSLWKIAEEHYSDPFVWKEIYELNQQVIGSDPNLILPLTEIKLPNL